MGDVRHPSRFDPPESSSKGWTHRRGVAGLHAPQSWRLSRSARHRLERNYGMGHRGTRPHFRGDPDRLHDLRFRCPFAQGVFRVASNTVGALGDVCNRYGDKLLHLPVQGTGAENVPAELMECEGCTRGQFLTLLG